MFTRIGQLAANRPVLVCAVWLVLAAAIALIAPSWDHKTQDDDIRFLPERCPSVRGYRLMEQAFPRDVSASRAVFAVERLSAPLSADDFALIDGMVADLEKLRESDRSLQINRVVSHRDPLVGNRLLSADRQCVLIEVSLGTPYLALQTRATVDRAEQVVRRRLDGVADAPAVHVTGAAGIGRDLTAASADSLDSTTLATILLVVVILLFVYRAPLLALIPLTTIALSVWVALKVLALCTLIPGFYLVNISHIFAVVMLYGAGTDYCLFLVSRYREELGKGCQPREALSNSVSGVGGALTASAGTVICGLGLMGLAEFAKVRCAGPAIAVSLGVALLGSLTLAPALLRLLGKAAFWPVGVPQGDVAADFQSAENRQSGALPSRTHADVWDRISRVVVARPLLVFCVSLLVLLPLAIIGLGVRSNYRATGELSPQSGSIQGMAAIQRHFVAGEVGPVTVLLESNTDWDSPQGRAALDTLSRRIGNVPNVAEVRSLTQPLGEPLEEEPAKPVPAGPPSPLARLLSTPKVRYFVDPLANIVTGARAETRKRTREFYVAQVPGPDGQPRYVTRLDVVLKSDPFEPASAHTLRTLEVGLETDPPGAEQGLKAVRSEFFGVTVNARDLATITESDRLRINTLVLAGIFLILLVVVRRFWLAAYLLLTVLFSYYATLGATTLLAHSWHGRPLGEVDWRVPFFLFTILVAVGEDYNILLITRALDERRKHGSVEGMRRALARTGGTITSCGLIMAGTFATLMLAGLNTLVQIGFALAFGVLLDTFVVRPFLVPALTTWFWRLREESMAVPPGPVPASELRRAG